MNSARGLSCARSAEATMETVELTDEEILRVLLSRHDRILTLAAQLCERMDALLERLAEYDDHEEE